MRTAGTSAARAVTACLGVVLCAVACGGSDGATSPTVSYVGGWDGTTSQGEPIQFYVTEQGIRLMAITFRIVGTSCTSYGTAWLAREAPDTAFPVTGTALSVATSGSAGTITITGSFTTATQATGTLVATSISCGGSISETWTAAKATAPAVDLTGTWTGTYSTSLVSTTPITLALVQSGATLSGTYSSTNGGVGTVRGAMSGTIGTFALTQTTVGCAGSFSGHAVLHVNPEVLFFAYGGSDCLGTHAHAGGMVSR